MVQHEITVTNALGIHARPASQIVQTATKFQASITIEKDGIEADAKSIMSVMMLAAAFNAKVVLHASGKDEKAALEAVEKLFAAKFGEE